MGVLKTVYSGISKIFQIILADNVAAAK